MIELLRYIFSGFVPFVGTLFLAFFVVCMISIVASTWRSTVKKIIFHIEGVELNERIDDLIQVLKERGGKDEETP